MLHIGFNSLILKQPCSYVSLTMPAQLRYLTVQNTSAVKISNLLVTGLEIMNKNHFGHVITKRKGRDLTQSHMYDKSPYTHSENQKVTWQHKDATKNFNYPMIASRLRTVSWSNNNHPTGVVYGYPTFPLTAKALYLKGQLYSEELKAIHVTGTDCIEFVFYDSLSIF